MTTTQKTLLTATFITLIILWFSKKKTKGNAVKNAIDDILSQDGGETADAPIDARLFVGQNSNFDQDVFYFITPAGTFTINNPDTSSPAYNALYNGSDYQFGWQAPTPGVIVVTLLPLEENPLVENVVIDLNEETIMFEYVQL